MRKLHIFVAICVLSGCGDDRPSLPESAIRTCSEYQSFSEIRKQKIISDWLKYKHKKASYYKGKKRSVHQRVPPDYAQVLKICFDSCDKVKYANSELSLYRFESECFEPGSEFKPPRFGGMTADSTCEDWGATNLDDREKLIDDLVRGTSMVRQRNYRPHKNDIFQCVNTTFATPCIVQTMQVRSAMAACMIMLGLR